MQSVILRSHNGLRITHGESEPNIPNPLWALASFKVTSVARYVSRAAVYVSRFIQSFDHFYIIF